ncbi:MAG: shikimate kinase [Cyanobacteria bacterium J06639_1]
MMGAGKSTVGRALAPQLGYQFFDTDTLIETAAGLTIPEIFAEQGEAGFREWETQVLAQLCPHSRLVVATGGGIVERSQNWSYLHHGLTLWLDVSAATLHQRLQAQRLQAQRLQSDATPRPLLETSDPLKTLTHLLDRRRTLYAQADVRISEAEKPLDILLPAIAEALQHSLRTTPLQDLAQPPSPPMQTDASIQTDES